MQCQPHRTQSIEGDVDNETVWEEDCRPLCESIAGVPGWMGGLRKGLPQEETFTLRPVGEGDLGFVLEAMGSP